MSEKTEAMELPSHCYSWEYRYHRRTFWQWLRRDPRAVYRVRLINAAGTTYIMNQCYPAAKVRELAMRPHPLMSAFKEAQP